MLDSLGRTPFVDSVAVATILGEPHLTIRRVLIGLIADCIVGRASPGTVYSLLRFRYVGDDIVKSSESVRVAVRQSIVV